MSQKSILITGCSSGIGLDAARHLRTRGWRVFAACRKPEDCARLIEEEGFESPLIDYEDEAGLQQGFAQVLDATGGTLDALFNNGAYAIPGALEDVPRGAMRAIFEANLIGWHDLTLQAIKVMRQQGHGRIVNCSSVLGMVPMRWRGAYVSTKFALEGLTDTLRLEMRDTPIHVSLIDPGPITSQFRKNAALQFEKWIDWEASARADQYRNTLRKRLYAASDTPDRFELGPEAVTKKLTHALEAPRPKARYYVTTPTYLMGAARRVLPTRALDWLLAKA